MPSQRALGAPGVKAFPKTGVYAVRVTDAGGWSRRRRLELTYRLHPNQRKTQVARSSDVGFDQTWASAKEITDTQVQAFRQWVETGRCSGAHAGGGGSRLADPLAVSPAVRSSTRTEELQGHWAAGVS
eukprot:CAMPEP_0119065544 /NCGR_PEP_ID=MMETSP1178-20130426/8341_1 /TAXON_ID=33656 /ORGANISM="unid sp, Strain CCMP2000" /LENGTH=127 /DNA_ID=CAMNT_0007047073 /DNA_START=8 /DNA_END=388 /DNA_ORIENTATION=+